MLPLQERGKKVPRPPSNKKKRPVLAERFFIDWIGKTIFSLPVMNPSKPSARPNSLLKPDGPDPAM